MTETEEAAQQTTAVATLARLLRRRTIPRGYQAIIARDRVGFAVVQIGGRPIAEIQPDIAYAILKITYTKKIITATGEEFQAMVEAAKAEEHPPIAVDDMIKTRQEYTEQEQRLNIMKAALLDGIEKREEPSGEPPSIGQYL